MLGKNSGKSHQQGARWKSSAITLFRRNFTAAEGRIGRIFPTSSRRPRMEKPFGVRRAGTDPRDSVSCRGRRGGKTSLQWTSHSQQAGIDGSAESVLHGGALAKSGLHKRGGPIKRCRPRALLGDGEGVASKESLRSRCRADSEKNSRGGGIRRTARWISDKEGDLRAVKNAQKGGGGGRGLARRKGGMPIVKRSV